MDGVHDLGGLDGFGPVEHTASEPLFDEEWERRAFRVMIGWIAAQNPPGGRFRHSIERMSPEHYLSSPYYEHWLTGAATMAVDAGSRRSTSWTAGPAGIFRCPARIAVCCPLT